MPSLAYTTLDGNITALKQLLPAVSPTGSYSPIEEIKIRAFNVLSHSELEHYFESRCREIITAYENNTNPVSGPGIQIRLTHYFSIKKREDYTPYNYIHANVCNSYEQMIVANNGIKEYNLFKLFWPLGIDNAMIPMTLLPDLDSYASRRGDFAHKGLHYSISFVLDPQNENNAITHILQDISQFDLSLDALTH